MRAFLELAYLGAPFHGWQTQPGASTVQQTIEAALGSLLRRDVPVTGAGRTDAGVNARRMVAHIDLNEEEWRRFGGSSLVRALNAVLPSAIRIAEVCPVRPDAHARFSAVERTYRYFAATRRTPFDDRLTWHTPRPLDFDAMNEAAARLTSVSDFTSFAKLHSDSRTNICRVSRALWRPDPAREGLWHFEIAADRFLRNMVRAVVGTLVEVGRGKMTTEAFMEVVQRRDRCAAGTSMPGEALFLWDVRYPADVYLTSTTDYE